MMKKIKSFFYKINKHLILYSIVLMVILVSTSFILKHFALKLRQWVYLTVAIILMILIFIYLVQKFIKKSKKTKLIIVLIFSTIITLCIIFWKISLLGLFVIISVINPKDEHLVQIEGRKYVASMEYSLLHTTVYYHKYINAFVMGYEPEITEYYNGYYDPIERKKEENIINSKGEYSHDEQTEIKTENPIDILYEKEISENTVIRIINEGYILGGRMLINIQETNDSGINWSNKLKNSDSCITVNNEAKFVFINEKVGFINNQSLLIVGQENNSLLVTVDGGESFKKSNFIYPLDIKETTFYIKDLPYLENNKLKIKLFPSDKIENSQSTCYEFISIDNGLNWMCD